jgi:hypothetical protein
MSNIPSIKKSVGDCQHEVKIIENNYYQWRRCIKCGMDFEIEYQR